jgi:hypothetical protein
MKIDLKFTQSNLQDFFDCPRRFELRYLLQLKWPAVQTEPELEQENHLRQGQNFHQLVHQHLLGQPVDHLSLQINDPDLQTWWENYLRSEPTAGITGIRYPEFTLSAPFEGFRLLAKYDLLIVDEDHKAVIFDWKTSRHHPAHRTLQQRIQTRLYPFLLVKAGMNLNGGQPIHPEEVEMIYWFAEEPDKPEHFTYTVDQFQQDQEFLSGLIREINQREPGNFLLTADDKQCRFCNYRSLCDRGIKPGKNIDWEDEPWPGSERPFGLDFEQIAEIEF